MGFTITRENKIVKGERYFSKQAKLVITGIYENYAKILGEALRYQRDEKETRRTGMSLADHILYV